MLARRHEVVPLVLVDPAERMLPSVGLVELDDLETGERRLLDTSDPRTRAAQQSRWKRLVDEELPGRFRRAGITPVFLPLDGDYIEPLFRYFQRRARRRASGR